MVFLTLTIHTYPPLDIATKSGGFGSVLEAELESVGVAAVDSDDNINFDSSILDLGLSAVEATDPLLGSPLEGVEVTTYIPQEADVLSQAISLARASLAQLTERPDNLDLLQTTFGERGDSEAALNLIEGLAEGQEFPAIELLDREDFKADGAFGKATQTVYLSKKFLEQNLNNPEAVATVLLKEIGHYIDARINRSDAPGDEGAIFAALVQGSSLDETELSVLKEEGDRAWLTKDDQTFLVEQSLSEIELPPDLIVSDVDVKDFPTWGERISVEWTVTNMGLGIAKASWYDGFYLSSDPVWDSSDRFVLSYSHKSYYNDPVAPGGSYTKSTRITLPGDETDKPYLLLVPDHGNTQIEVNESNNATVIAQLDSPDLVVSDVTIKNSPTWGEKINVDWTVTNQGESTALYSWYDGFYLSSDPVWDSSDRFVTSRSYNYYGQSKYALASGDSYNRSTRITLPGDETDKPYLLLVPDRHNNQLETDESNNATVIAQLSSPDLVVSDVTIKNSPTWGEKINVDWTVTNQGKSTAYSNYRNQRYDGVYLSSDPFLDSSDYKIASSAQSLTSLSSGDSYTATKSITLSEEHADKPFLLLSTDYYNRVTETDESNNVQAFFLRELFEDPDKIGQTLVEALENTWETAKDVWDTTKEFTQGFTYRYFLSNASLMLPLTDPLDPRGVEMRRRLEEVKRGSVAFQVGQGAADLAGVAQGMLEVLNGLGLMGGGAATVPMTGGASVGAIALVNN